MTALGAAGVNLLQATGEEALQTVFHFRRRWATRLRSTASPSACDQRPDLRFWLVGGPGRFLSHPLFILSDMERQLTLIEVPQRRWTLDERTREAGKRGIAEARKALAEAARKHAA